MVSQTEESGLCCAHSAPPAASSLWPSTHKGISNYFLEWCFGRMFTEHKTLLLFKYTITCKNNLWESTFGRQSLRNWARMHCELVHGVRVWGWRERRGVQSSALLRPAPYKGRRVRWGSVRPHLWAQSAVSSQTQIQSCEYSSQAGYLFLQHVSPDFRPIFWFW